MVNYRGHKALFTLLFLTLLIGCSGKKTKRGVSAVSEDKVVSNQFDDDMELEGDLVLEEPSDTSDVDLSSIDNSDGEFGVYQTKKGDTLMLIAFNIYREIDRWKELRDLNPRAYRRQGSIPPGTFIKYRYPDVIFDMEIPGEPYLILRGDTLGKISKKVYFTSRKWRKIWKNNLHLIKDPNLIYAGFTLYYIPEKSRELASKK